MATTVNALIVMYFGNLYNALGWCSTGNLIS
jgi:hypothetical protein